MTSEHTRPSSSAHQPPAQQVNHSGLALRTALLKLGHHTGYTTQEIEDVNSVRGITAPEITFYFSLVREGKVADGPNGEILASKITADFGAHCTDYSSAEPQTQKPNDVVHPVLAHPHWVEIAHDSQTLYAVDLAPGPAGKSGQVIARSAHKPEVPRLVADSLSQFITGDWLQQPDTTASADKNQENAEPAQADYVPEDEIVDLRSSLETHNADKLNETERDLADDFAAIAFGTDPQDRLERVQKRWESEDNTVTPEKPAPENAPPKTRREAIDKEHQKSLKETLKKFFLG